MSRSNSFLIVSTRTRTQKRASKQSVTSRLPTVSNQNCLLDDIHRHCQWLCNHDDRRNIGVAVCATVYQQLQIMSTMVLPMASPKSLKRNFDEVSMQEGFPERNDEPQSALASPIPSSMPSSTPQTQLAPSTSNLNQAAPPADSSKKPKLSFAEKEAQRIEKEFKEQQKAEDRIKKEQEKLQREKEKVAKEEERLKKAEEKAAKEEERLKKADEKKQKDEERRKIKEEKDKVKEEERIKREEEKQKKDEEKAKKERVCIMSIFNDR